MRWSDHYRFIKRYTLARFRRTIQWKRTDEKLIESSLSKDKERWIEWNRQREGGNHSDRLAKMIDLAWKNDNDLQGNRSYALELATTKIKKWRSLQCLRAHWYMQPIFLEGMSNDISSHSLIERQMRKMGFHFSRLPTTHTLIPRAGWEAI